MQAVRIVRWAALGLTLALGAAAFAFPEADPANENEKWMVDDAEVVVAINMKQLVGSQIMQKGGTDAVKAAINGNEQLKSVLEATGVDPLKDINTILVSGTGSSAKDVKALFVLRGKFDLDKVQGAAEKFAKKNPDELKLSKADKVNLYEVKVNDMPMFAAFIDSTALVMTPSKDATLEAVKSAGKKPAKVKADLKGAAGKFTGKETMAFALLVTKEMQEALGKLPQAADVAPKLHSVTGTINLTDSATTVITINTEDAKAAKQVLGKVTQLQALVAAALALNDEVPPVAKEMITALKLAQDKSSVTASLKVTAEMIEKANKKDDKKDDK